MTTIRNLILIIVNDAEEIHGTETLVRILREEFETGHDRAWTREQLAALEASGELEILHHGPGRGHKNIIRKNRNSPGYPRRTI